jgi:F-type H+-transporting ATPase subunit a
MPTLIGLLKLPPLPGLSHFDSLLVENTWVAMFVIIVLLLVVALRMKKIPGALQNGIEMIVDFLETFISRIVGENGMLFFPLVATVFFFILFSNYIGLVPGFIAPTVSINTTAAWGILIFVVYNAAGIIRHRFKYVKQFIGPIWWMAPLMMPIEIISHLARPVSLGLRLYCNMLAGEVIIGLLFSLCAIGAPVIWMTWESLITCWFQAFVFSILTMVYLGGAIGAEEGH